MQAGEIYVRFPDLILMDGWLTGNIALQVLDELKLNIPVCGMAKMTIIEQEDYIIIMWKSRLTAIQKHLNWSQEFRMKPIGLQSSLSYSRVAKVRVHSVLDDIE